MRVDKLQKITSFFAEKARETKIYYGKYNRKSFSFYTFFYCLFRKLNDSYDNYLYEKEINKMIADRDFDN